MSGMAEVLAAHQRDHGKRTLHEHCSCGWFGQVLGGDFTNHQAAMLTAAGFGPVKEAGAVALEEAADELAKLPYVKPGAPGRADYEMVLAVRRGMADAWLKTRAAAIRNASA